jgi:Metallo-peptidase family M12/Domain of unknown function DUF11
MHGSAQIDDMASTFQVADSRSKLRLRCSCDRVAKGLLRTLSAGLLLLGLASTAAAGGLRILAFEPAQLRWYAQPAGAGTPSKSLLDAESARLSFEAYGRHFDAELLRNRVLERAVGSVRARAYGGHLDGLPGSWIRVTLQDEDVDGLLWDGSDLYVIAPARDAAPDLVPPLLATSPSLIYRLRDTLLDTASLCAVVADRSRTGSTGQQAYDAITRQIAAATGAGLALDLGVVADAELLAISGSARAVRDRLTVRLNNVDGIFGSQLGVRVQVRDMTVYDARTDPFSATTSPNTLLREFADQRSRDPALQATGLAHLFTGRNLDGDTVGVAYLDTLCDPRLGVSLAQNRGSSAAYESLVTAHELGHNFGAPHDGEPGACASTPQTYLMAPRINGNDEFSDCSRRQIEPRIAAATCLTSVATSELILLIADPQRRLLTARAEAVELVVSNTGAAVARSPRVTATASDLLELAGATTTAGTCSTTTAQLDCRLDDLPAAGSARIVIDVLGKAAGTGTLDVLADATSEDPSGSTVAAQLAVTIEDGVDLAIAMSGPESVAVDQSFEIAATVTHRTGARASNVDLVLNIPAGLRPEDAGLQDGVCSVATTSIECSRSALDPLRETTLHARLVAVTSGRMQLSTSVASSELDPVPDNNVSTLTVAATGPASATQSTGGGGGGDSLLWLAALALGNRCRRQKSRSCQRDRLSASRRPSRASEQGQHR